MADSLYIIMNATSEIPILQFSCHLFGLFWCPRPRVPLFLSQEWIRYGRKFCNFFRLKGKENQMSQQDIFILLQKVSSINTEWGAFSFDVRWFLWYFWPTYLNQVHYYIHKPIYLNQMQIDLPKNLTSYVNASMWWQQTRLDERI